MPRLIEAGGFLLFHPGDAPSFLLMQHVDRWDLPKGHAESGEDILQTALRETEEETGLTSPSIDVDSDFRYVSEYSVAGAKRGDYLKRVTYFLGYVPHIFTPELTEHIGFRWFTWPHPTPIQTRAIDPLLAAVTAHFQSFPHRVQGKLR